MKKFDAILLYKEVFMYAQFMSEGDISALIKYIGSVVFGYGEPPTLSSALQDVATDIISKHREQETKTQAYSESRSANRKKGLEAKNEHMKSCDEHMKSCDEHMKSCDEHMNTNSNSNSISISISKKESVRDIAPKRNTPVKPTKEAIAEYCKERNNGIDADYFYDYYEARGWKYSNNQPMKDFKAAVRTWERNGKNKGGASAPQMRTHPNVLHQEDMPCTDF